MGVKTEAGNVWQSVHSDIGNTYQAVLTQDSGWKARSSDIGDPLTDAAAQEQGGGFGGQFGGEFGGRDGWGKTTVKNVSLSQGFKDAGNNPSPDSGFGPGKSDQEPDRG